jgi:hypothetical protein
MERTRNTNKPSFANLVTARYDEEIEDMARASVISSFLNALTELH